MNEKENSLHHRLTHEEFFDFLEQCRDEAKTHLDYDHDELFLICYLELRGVILPSFLARYQMNHTFKNASLMTSLDKIMEDALRYYKVFIKKYASVIDSALKNVVVHQTQGYFDVSEEKVEAIVLRLVKELKSERKYINEAAFGFQYMILSMFPNFSCEVREKVGELLVEIKYNDICNIVDEIGKVKPQDAFECNNVYALKMIQLDATGQYSRASQRFTVYLADVGLLTALTVYITEAGYMSYLHEEALINFPKVNNNFRELLIMMSLVNTMDDHELVSLSDESNVINTIIEYMQKALDNECRTYFITLCQLTDGLSKLTIKSSNSSKIVHTEGALSALVNMLRYENVKENASAVECIHALVQDNAVRSTILEFPDLVSAIDDLRKTTSVKLKKIIDDTLKTLQSCTPAVAGPGTIAEDQDMAMPGQSLPAAMHHLSIGVNQLKNSFQHKNQSSKQPFVNFFVLDQSAHVTNVVQQEEKFTARGSSEKLRPEDEQTILRHWKLLIEEVDATHITRELISRGVFDVDDKREILGPKSRKKRTEIMLKKLLNAGPGSAYETFLDVLEVDHAHIVDELRKQVLE